MSIIVDKRGGSRDRTSENRQRFLKRIRGTIKDQLPDIIGRRSLKDLDKRGGNIRVNRKTITEPTIYHGKGGNVDTVLPGNDQFVEGDLLPKPKGGGGGGGPDGEDDFIVELTREEFLAAFFEGLELPDMIQTSLSKIKKWKRENAGFQTEGAPNRLSVERSYRQALGRKITIRASLDKRIENLESQIEIEASRKPQDKGMISELREELVKLKYRRDHIPMFEEMDLRYHLSVPKAIAVEHATMILIQDNSGSMGLKEKTIARKFFWLMYKFLDVMYEGNVDLRFISHTETAVEMDEQDFFNTSLSGGTVVSSALEMAAGMIKELKGQTNIYISQLSDGDNYEIDNGNCSEILEDDILPFIRYMAYVQVDHYHAADNPLSTYMHERGLWKTYQIVSGAYPKLQNKRVVEESDIYAVFRELFTKR